MPNGAKAYETRKAAEALRHAEGQARDLFAKAAAAMTEPTTENKALALFWAALGLVKMAESDPGDEVLVRVEQVIRRAAGRGAPSPGPYSGT